MQNLEDWVIYEIQAISNGYSNITDESKKAIIYKCYNFIEDVFYNKEKKPESRFRKTKEIQDNPNIANVALEFVADSVNCAYEVCTDSIICIDSACPDDGSCSYGTCGNSEVPPDCQDSACVNQPDCTNTSGITQCEIQDSGVQCAYSASTCLDNNMNGCPGSSLNSMPYCLDYGTRQNGCLDANGCTNNHLCMDGKGTFDCTDNNCKNNPGTSYCKDWDNCKDQGCINGVFCHDDNPCSDNPNCQNSRCINISQCCSDSSCTNTLCMKLGKVEYTDGGQTCTDIRCDP